MSAAIRNDARAPASEAALLCGSGVPGSRSGAPALDPRAMAALLRGAAREDDGAAVALFARLGLSAAETLSRLPQARALARANLGA